MRYPKYNNSCSCDKNSKSNVNQIESVNSSDSLDCCGISKNDSVTSCGISANVLHENENSLNRNCSCDIGCCLDDYSSQLSDMNSAYSMSWPKNPELATAYVPFQTLNNLYTPCQGLERGTIFPELSR